MNFLIVFFTAVTFTGMLSAQTQTQDSACVQALNAAVAQGEKDQERILDLTELCIGEGQAAAAQRVLLAWQDKITDMHLKLALLRPLKWAADSAGKTAELKKLFTERRDARPGSALAWLELAEVEGTTHSIPAQQHNLANAATLAWADEVLLREILDRMEEAGWWDDALKTAEVWGKNHPTPLALCRLAALYMIVGDDARAWDLAAEAVKDPRVTAGELQDLARVACERREWEPLNTLLAQALPKFPRHLGLLSLQAVVLEEAGRDEEAAKAFLHLLGTHEELAAEPVVPLLGWVPGGVAEVRARDFSDQPPGTRDFTLQEAWRPLAYAHRAPVRTNRWERGPENTVHLPAAQDEARIFALEHLYALNAGGDQKLREDIHREMAAGGLAHMAAKVGECDSKPKEMADVLKMNPDNQALHAWWLSNWHGRLSSGDMQVLQHCVEMFASRYPVPAFKAARELAASSSPEKERYQEQALALFREISKTLTPFVVSTVYQFALQTKDWKNSAAWQDAILAVQSRAARELPDDWTHPRTRMSGYSSRYELVLGWMINLEVWQRWGEYGQALENEAHRQEPVEWVIQHYPGASYGRGAPLLGKDGVLFPNVLLRWPRGVTETLGVFYSAKTRAESTFHPKGPWIGMLHDPRLKLVAQWRHGEAAEARAEMERRLASPDATLEDWWLGAWLAWEADTKISDEASVQKAALLAAERLAKAAEFPLEGIARSYLDAALLQAVRSLRERPPELIKAAHKAAIRLCSGTLVNEYEGKELQVAFQSLGFTQEDARVSQMAVVPHVCESIVRRPWRTATDTVTCLRRTPPRIDVAQEQKKAATTDARVREVMRQLHQPRSEMTESFVGGEMIKQWKEAGIWDAVLAAAKPREGATARELLRAGLDFELLGQIPTACQQYEAALRLNDKLDEARVQLVRLTVREREDEAFAVLKQMDHEKIGPLLEQLNGRLFYNPGVNQTADNDCVMKLQMRWLQHLEKSRLEIPASSVLPLQHLMMRMEKHPAQLCRTALAFRELADIAFGSIAEEALREKRPLTEVAALARDLLKAKAAWMREPQRSYGYIMPQHEALPAAGVVTQPGPALILVWEAWQRQAAPEVESAILPALRSAEKINEEAVRDAAALFFCAPEKFVETADRFLTNDEKRNAIATNEFFEAFHANTLDCVTLVWRLRKLKVPLAHLFLARIGKLETEGYTLKSLAAYLGLADQMTAAQSRSFVRDLRDQLVDRDPARRREFIARFVEQSQGTSSSRPGLSQRQVALPPGTGVYVSWLRSLLAQPRTCRVALEMAIEDGLTEWSTWRVNDLLNAFWQVDEHDSENFIAMLNGFSMLAPAQEFRTWAMESDPSSSLFDTAADVLLGDRRVSKPALELVKAIQPETFGSGLMLAWAAIDRARDDATRKAAALRFMNAHREEFKLIPGEHWQEIGVFLKNLGGWSKPWLLSAKERTELAPVIEVQERYLAHFASRLMASEHWEDFKLSGYSFVELSSDSFISCSKTDPATAAALAVKAFSLLGKPARYPDPNGSTTPKDPQREWVWRAVETPGARAVLRPVIQGPNAAKGLSQARREEFMSVMEEARNRQAR